MRLSFSKIVVAVGAFALAIALVAVGLVFAAPREAALAETELQIVGLSGQPTTYGDVLFAGGKIRGNRAGDVFEVNAAGNCYIRADEIYVSASSFGPSDDVVALCDEAGRVHADVLATYDKTDPIAGAYWFTYYSSGNKLFRTVPVYNYADDSATAYVISMANLEGICWQVAPRPITVAFNVGESKKQGNVAMTDADVELTDGITYVKHTYGDLAYDLSFEPTQADALMEAFNDQLTMATAFEGNDTGSHVGYYPIADMNLQINRGETSVSSNYAISAAGDYGIKVVPCPIEIESFTRSSYFTAQRTEPHTSQFFAKENVDGVNGQALTVYFDVDDTQEGIWDQDAQGNDRVGIVAIKESAPYWDALVTYWTVGGEGSADDYVVTTVGHVYVKVAKRKIVLYDAATPPAGDGEKVNVQANDIEIGKTYGDTYDGDPVDHAITIDNTDVILSFDVKYQGKTLADYLADEGLDAIRLPVGQYDIVASVNDNHYIVTVDDSVKWTITKKALSYDTLVSYGLAGTHYTAVGSSAAAKAFKTYLTGIGKSSGICIAEYDYLAARAEPIALNYAFTDGDTQQQVEQAVDIEDAHYYPGYYAVGYTNDNYAIAGDVLYVRIKPVPVTLTLPGGVVYDGAAHTASVLYAGDAANPFEGQWSVALTYKNGNASANPVNAGTYTVSVGVEGPAEMAHNPYLAYAGAGQSFTISRKVVTVTLRQTATLSKIFAQQVSASSLTFDKDGFVGQDTVSLSSDGLAVDAAPGNYAIVATVSTGLASNYDLVLRSAAGVRDPKFVVNRIAVDDVIGYFNGAALQRAVASVSYTSFTLADVQYNGISIQDVGYEYSTGNNVWTAVSGEVSGLSEGTKYYVRIVIKANGRYVATSANVYTDQREVITAITQPVLTQDVVASSGRSVTVGVDNFDSNMTYAFVVYDAEMDLPEGYMDKAVTAATTDGTFSIARAYNALEDEDTGEMRLGQLKDLAEGGTYYIVVVAKTKDNAAASEPLTVYTRTAAPTLVPTALTVSATAVEVPKGYYVYVKKIDNTAALPVSSVIESTMQATGITYAMLAESEATLEAAYIDSVLANLSPNTSYAIAIWSQGEEDVMPSDVQCFTFRTLIDKTNRFAYTGAMLVASRYILISMLALNLVLFVVCTVCFVHIKKNITGGHRHGKSQH